MEIDNLVKLVTEEVLKKLDLFNDERKQLKSKKILILDNLFNENEKLYKKIASKWENTRFLNEINIKNEIESFDYIIVPKLSNKDLASIALAIDNSQISTIITDGLLYGKEIVVIKEGIYYRKFKKCINNSFYNMLETYEKQLINFGINIIKEENLFSILENNEGKDKNSMSKQILNENKITKKVVIESDIIKLFEQGYKEICVNEKAIVSPLALDYIKLNGINIIRR